MGRKNFGKTSRSLIGNRIVVHGISLRGVAISALLKLGLRAPNIYALAQGWSNVSIRAWLVVSAPFSSASCTWGTAGVETTPRDLAFLA
jgi:hypothetical protein